MTISKRLISVLLAVMMVLSMFTIIPAAAAEELTVSACALYKSHKLEWTGDSTTKTTDYTITKSGSAVTANITSVTVGDKNYYTALVEVGTGADANITYTVSSANYTGNATVTEVTGREALIKNALVSADYRKETDGYKSFDGKTVVDLKISDVKVAQLKALASGSAIVSMSTNSENKNQAVISLSDSNNGDKGVFVGTRNTAKQLGFRLNNTWKGSYPKLSVVSETINAISIKNKSGLLVASNGAIDTTFATRTDATFISPSANDITGAYIGGAKDSTYGFTGNIYYALFTEETYTKDEIVAITDNGEDFSDNYKLADEPYRNTFAFFGGRNIEGTYNDVSGARNLVSQFDELIRYQAKTKDMDSLTRFVINMGKTGNDLGVVIKTLDTNLAKVTPQTTVYMVGPEDIANGSEKATIDTFKANLKTFIEKSFALRENTGRVIIVNPYTPADASKKDTATAYAVAVNEVVKALGADVEARIVVVDLNNTTGNATFASYINADGYLNQFGQLYVATQIGNTIGFGYSINNGNLNKELETAPSVYNKDAKLDVVANADNTLTIKSTAFVNGTEYAYEVETASYTVTGKATYTEDGIKTVALTQGEEYTLTVTTVDGTTQYVVMSGKVVATEKATEKKATLNANQQAIADLMNSKDSLTWLFMGDSITHGCVYTYGYDSVSQVFEKYLKHDLGRTNDLVINTGVSSATTKTTIADIEGRLKVYTPDVVLIQLGMNDYLDNINDGIKTIIDTAREVNKDVKFVIRTSTPTTGSAGDGATRQNHVDNTIKNLYELVKTTGYTDVIIADQNAAFDKLTDNATYLANGQYTVLANYIHPGINGQILMARATIDALGLDTYNSEVYNSWYKTSHTTVSNDTTPAVNTTKNSITLNRSEIGTGYSYITLTATNGTNTYSVKVDKDGSKLTLNNLPTGTYTVNVSAESLTESKTVNFTSQNVELSDNKPVSTVNVSDLNAVALYKSHKITWTSDKNLSFTIQVNDQEVNTNIQKIAATGKYYYTAIIEVGTDVAGKTYSVYCNEEFVKAVTVADKTGKESLIKNALVSVDYRKEASGYKSFDGSTVIDLGATEYQLATLKSLASGSIVISSSTTSANVNQAVLSLSNTATNNSGIFIGTRNTAKQLGFVLNGVWKGSYNGFGMTTKSTSGVAIEYGKGAVVGHNGAVDAQFKSDSRAVLFSSVAGDVTGIYVGGAKDKSCAFTGNIYYALITEEVLTEKELMDITDTGVMPTIKDTMFNGNSGNTWVFVGGRTVEGPYSDVNGVKNLVSEFEEYSRTTYNMGYADGNNSLTGNPNRERYVINAGKSGNTLADILANYDRLVTENDPKAINYMVGVEDYTNATDDAIATFKANLKKLIDKTFVLRNGKGYVVIDTPYAPADATLNANAKKYADAVKEVVAGLSDDYSNRVEVIDLFTQTNNADFQSKSLNADGSLNGVGHLEISKLMEKQLIGSCADWTVPTLEFDGVSIHNTDATVLSTMNGTSLEITVSGVADGSKWTYSVAVDGSYTVSKLAGNTVTFENLPANKAYTLTVVSQDGTTQLPVMAGETVDGNICANAVKFETLTKQQQAIQDLLNSEEPLTWMFMGDSITHGVGMYGFKAYDNLAGLFNKYVREELGREDDIVINSAVSSATTTSTIVRIDERLNRYSPDVVSVQLGTNDSTLTGLIPVEKYKENLETLIKAIQAKGAIPILRAPIARLDTSSTGGVNQSKYVDVCKELAEKYDIICIDQYAITSEHIAKNAFLANSDRNGYMFFYNGDNLHVTTNGQIAMTRMFLDGIGCNTLDSAIYNNVFKITNSAESNASKPQLSLNEGTIAISNSAISNVYSNKFSYVTLTATNGDLTYTVKGDNKDLGVSLSNLPNGTYNVTTSVRLTAENKTVTFASQQVTLDDKVKANVSFSLALENSKIIDREVGTVIGTLSNDFGSIVGEYTYALNGTENDNALFTIDGTTLKIKSELEQGKTYTVSIKATVSGQEAVKTFTLSTIARDGLVFGETNIEVTGNNGVSLTDKSYKNEVMNLTEGTFIIRFKSTSTYAIQSLISVSNKAVNAEHFHIYVKPDGSIGMESRDGSNTVSFLQSAGLDISKTNTIAVKYDGAKYTIFTNGAKIGEYTRNSFIKGISSSLNAITVGAVARNNSASYQFNGNVDFVNCYSVALSDKKLIEMTKSTFVPESTSATVTFDMNGATAKNVVNNVEKGSKVTAIADPTRDGYKFTGWYVDAQLSAKFDFNTTINADTTIYAGWTVETGVAVTDEPIVVKTGDTVTVTYKLTAPAYIVDTQFNINYDRTVLELVSKDNKVNFPVISNGNLQVNYDADKIYVASSIVSKNDADLGNFKSGATLCTLTFKALKDATTKVTFTPDTIGGKNANGINENEIEYAVDGKISKAVKLDRDVKITNVPVVTVNYGDIDNDGKLDSTDATLILQSYAGIKTFSADVAKVADVNNDGKVDSTDATLVLQKYAGLIDTFER